MRIEPAGKTGLFFSHENQPPWEDRCGPMIYYARPVVLQYLLYTRNTEYTQQRLKEYCHFFSDDGDDSTIFRSFLGYYYLCESAWMRIKVLSEQHHGTLEVCSIHRKCSYEWPTEQGPERSCGGRGCLWGESPNPFSISGTPKMLPLRTTMRSVAARGTAGAPAAWSVGHQGEPSLGIHEAVAI